MSKQFPLSRIHWWSSASRAIHAVSEVSLELRRGETLGLVGESGCGKTTLGRIIVGLETPDSGDVLVDGQSLSSVRGRARRRLRRRMQFMFQDPYSSLDPRMRVGRVVEEPLVIQRLGNRTARAARVDQLLSEVGLGRRLTRSHAHELSGGQRQRVALARVLAPTPTIVVADEPVSALDVSIRSQVLNLLRDVQAAHGLSLVVISHDLSAVRHLATRVAVMYLGKVVEVGPTKRVLDAPSHHYTAGLIASLPSLEPQSAHPHDSELLQGELPSPIDPPSGCRFRTRCPMASALCADQEPVLAEISLDHYVACHFPRQLAEP